MFPSENRLCFRGNFLFFFLLTCQNSIAITQQNILGAQIVLHKFKIPLWECETVVYIIQYK